ncbi:MAG: DUF3455 domain-containing protein [Bryobacteraceae bacterium]|jgi:hypothetical protein
MRVYLVLLWAVLAFAQSDTKAPEGQRVALTATGKGVQIYSCQNVSGSPQWVFVAPEATLFNEAGVEIGTHGAGPVWKFHDGKVVKGQVVAKSDAPGAGDIPWLLLKGEGSFEYIRRSETRGGVAPGGGCEVGRTERVGYSAVYTFYVGR